MKTKKYPIFLSTWSVNKLIFNGRLPLTRFPEFCRKNGFDGMEINDSFLAKLSMHEQKELEHRIRESELSVSLAITNDFTITEPPLLETQHNHVEKLLAFGYDIGIISARIYVGGKSKLAHKLWQRQLAKKQPQTKAASNKKPSNHIFRFLMHHRFRKMRELVGNRLFARQNLDSNTFEHVRIQIHRALSIAEKYEFPLVIENHGGYSEKPENLLRFIHAVNSARLGLCPDIGNFPPSINRYQALEQLLPYAQIIHTKSYEFSVKGEETSIEYGRIMGIIKKSGFSGPLVVEFEGPGDPVKNSLKTKQLIERFL